MYIDKTDSGTIILNREIVNLPRVFLLCITTDW